MSKSDLSLSLGQKRVSGQLNKVTRTLIAEGHIGFTIPEKPRSRRQQLESKLGSQPESQLESRPECFGNLRMDRDNRTASLTQEHVGAL